MIIATYEQQPADVLDYDIPFELATGDSIGTSVSSVTPSGLTATPVIIGGDTVKLWVSSGVSGTTYKIELTTTTALGRVKQVEIKVKVKDR